MQSSEHPLALRVCSQEYAMPMPLSTDMEMPLCSDNAFPLPLCSHRHSAFVAAHAVSTTVVDCLKSKLMSTTKEFKDALTMRTENLRVHENRRQLFSATSSQAGGNPFARQKPLGLANGMASSSSASPAPWENGTASGPRLFNAKDITASRGESTESLFRSIPTAATSGEEKTQQGDPTVA